MLFKTWMYNLNNINQDVVKKYLYLTHIMYKKHKRRIRNKPSQECLEMILTLTPLLPFNVFTNHRYNEQVKNLKNFKMKLIESSNCILD
jgi:hypothetical protein